MEKKSLNGAAPSARSAASQNERTQQKRERGKKVTEYGRQLEEKQKVKRMYGLRERQFKRFYAIATRSKTATGEMLLSLLERRLDNVLYRLKLATTRRQARQICAHGHVYVNGVKVSAASYLVAINDIISLSPIVETKATFLEQVVDKRLNSGAKVPDWLEVDKKARRGVILRFPVRSDIQTPIEEHHIIELYSK